MCKTAELDDPQCAECNCPAPTWSGANFRQCLGLKFSDIDKPSRSSALVLHVNLCIPCQPGIKPRLASLSWPHTITAMETLAIYISWEFFLGLMGSLIAIAYYANGRFTGLETDVQWLKERISDLLINAENVRTKLIKNESPVSLTAAGYNVLRRSGLKSYIDTKKPILLTALNARAPLDRYELQCRAFRLLDKMSFEDVVEHHLNNFAFVNGISTELLRRIAAIYLRDIAAQSK